MSEDMTPAESSPTTPATGDEPGTTESLRGEVERLRRELARVSAEAAEYKRAAYRLLGELEPYTRPTDEELHELMHGPRGEPLRDVLAEYERRLGG